MPLEMSSPRPTRFDRDFNMPKYDRMSPIPDDKEKLLRDGFFRDYSPDDLKRIYNDYINGGYYLNEYIENRVRDALNQGGKYKPYEDPGFSPPSQKNTNQNNTESKTQDSAPKNPPTREEGKNQNKEETRDNDKKPQKPREDKLEEEQDSNPPPQEPKEDKFEGKNNQPKKNNLREDILKTIQDEFQKVHDCIGQIENILISDPNIDNNINLLTEQNKKPKTIA